MKIALIGTHGVGKTTLAFDICSLLKKAGQNVELVTEVARRSPFPINEATTLEGQLWILHAQIAAELVAAYRAPHVICDRAVIDNYCYLMNKSGPQPGLEPWLETWTTTYDLLAHVPLSGSPPPADGIRAEDRSFQERIEKLLHEVLGRPPFQKFAKRVLWLDPDRNRWAEQVFSAAEPIAARPGARLSYQQQFLNF
jgi:hypothetical protein